MCHLFDGVCSRILHEKMDAELQCIRDAGNSKKSVVYDYWDRDRSRFFVFADCRRSIGKYDHVSVPESDFLNAGKRNCSVKGDVAYLCERYVGGVGGVYNCIDGDQGYRIGFQSGQGIDQKHCKRTYAAEEDKVIHNSRNHNLYDRYIRIPAVRNHESMYLLFAFFAGIFLLIRFVGAGYLRRAKKTPAYLPQMLNRNHLYYKSKTTARYVLALTILNVCAVFYFLFQVVSVTIAEKPESLYPYDFVCIADDGDDAIFDRIKNGYQAKIIEYPMVRVANADKTEQNEGVQQKKDRRDNRSGFLNRHTNN